MFLIACYARYANPYVWVSNISKFCTLIRSQIQVRSNHERLVILSENAIEKDYPLQLKSTSTCGKVYSCTEVWL